MCDYLSEYLRMCFRLYEDLSWPFVEILRTFCKWSKNKTKWEQFLRNAQIVQNNIWMILISFRQKRLPCRLVFQIVSDCSTVSIIDNQKIFGYVGPGLYTLLAKRLIRKKSKKRRIVQSMLLSVKSLWKCLISTFNKWEAAVTEWIV